jgi:hypothetical protein
VSRVNASQSPKTVKCDTTRNTLTIHCLIVQTISGVSSASPLTLAKWTAPFTRLLTYHHLGISLLRTYSPWHLCTLCLFFADSLIRYSFFADQDLHTIYNSVGYDPETDQSASPNQTSIPDADLLNPIYLAFAGRIPSSFESAGSTLNEDPGIFASSEPGMPNYAEFVLRCSLTTYEVEYSWVNRSIENVSFSISPNGTLLEIFHGSQFYFQVTGGDHDLQDYLQQAALQNTSNTFASAFANLYSTKILSTIGAYATGQTTLQEQTRTRLLVAKVQVSALGALVGCSLAYTVLGIGLAITAYRVSSIDVRDIAAQLSLPGLTAAAFGEKNVYASEHGGARSGAVFNEKLTRRETSRVVVDGSPRDGYNFRVYV